MNIPVCIHHSSTNTRHSNDRIFLNGRLTAVSFKDEQMKMAYLDRAGVREHGVHPDVPKNVSKSITVD